MDRLILFDVDFTLMNIPELGEKIFPPAFAEVYGVNDCYLRTGEIVGLTDWGIIIMFMESTGMDRKEIEKKLPDAMRSVTKFFNVNVEKDLRQFVLPGVRELLASLKKEGMNLGLLTGNIEEVAWEKMRRAGLDGIFSFGGFGGYAEKREDLPPIAKEMAERKFGKKFPMREMVIIGDTPNDIKCAKANGAKSIGVCTGPFSEKQLKDAGADLVVASLRELTPEKIRML
jgi:phosphoglycolate phosphatase-like HAD superfamily hydrolase